MKLVTFKVSTPVGPVTRIGALLGEEKIVDLTLGYVCYLQESGEETKLYESANLRIPPDMIEYFKGGELSRNSAQQTVDHASHELKKKKEIRGPRGEKVIYDLREVKLMAPVPKPTSIRMYGTYERHPARIEAAFSDSKKEWWYNHAVCIWKGNPLSVIGPDDPIVRPYYATKYFDCELEIGFYIGKEGRDIPLDKAKEYVAGFTIYNDPSARVTGTRRDVSKMKDFCNVMGPWIVTPDEIDETNLKVIYRVNGEVWFEGNTGTRRSFFSPELIAYASDNETLYPGEFFTGGTNDFACADDIGKRWIEPGDLLEFEIEGIGVLRNRVIQGEKKVDYVMNGIKGHLEYTGPKTKPMPLPMETDGWKSWKAPPGTKIVKSQWE